MLWRRLEYDLLPCLLLCLASYLSFFVFLFIIFLFFACIAVVDLLRVIRLCSRHLLLSASTYFTVRVLSACVLCTLPHIGIILYFYSFSIFFRNSYFSGGVVFCCALVPGTLALDLPTLILYHFIFLRLAVCDHRILYLSRMQNQEGHWGYCSSWCRWVERTV